MQISSTPTAYGGSEAQRLLNMLLQQQPSATGQDLPGADSSTASATSTPAAPQTSTISAAQFTSDTLSSLLSAQEAPPSASDIASQIIKTADTNGDGALSLSEIETAIGADTTSGASSDATALSAAFAKLDTNGDGEVSASELTNALSAQQASQSAQGPQGAHHHHHHAHGAGGAGGASSTDLASQLLGSADTDGDGELSVSEIESALGVSSTASADATSALTSAISSLDTNGDGKLSSTEISVGIDAFRAAHHRSGAESAQASASSQNTVTA